MSGAHQSMHRPRRANHSESTQTVYKHSATPLETPPRWAGNGLVSNRKPARSTNEAAKMQKSASWFQKVWIVVENGGAEDRRRFRTSRLTMARGERDCKRYADSLFRLFCLASNPIVAKRIEARFQILSRTLTLNWAHT